MNPDWTCFKQRIPVSADAKAIYDALATQAGIESWFLASAEFTIPGGKPRDPHALVVAGDAYLWKWYGFPGGSPESGKVVEANGLDRVRFTFTENCLVTFSVLSENGEQIVELVQENIAPDENLEIYLGCSTGWIFYLTNLKSILEGGIDLRNKNANLGGVINA